MEQKQEEIQKDLYRQVAFAIIGLLIGEGLVEIYDPEDRERASTLSASVDRIAGYLSERL